MLKYISLQKHPGLVEFFEDFEYNEKPCLVFELLHMDLLEFTGRHYTCRANLYAIRTIAQQVCVILEQISYHFTVPTLHPMKYKIKL